MEKSISSGENCNIQKHNYTLLTLIFEKLSILVLDKEKSGRRVRGAY